MTYEVFVRRGRMVRQPLITITKAGHIVFNKAMVDDTRQSPMSMLLFWDADTQCIGFKPVTMHPGAQPVYRRKSGAGFFARKFLEHIGYDYTRGTRRFIPTWNTDLAMYEIDLTAPAPPEE